MHFSVLSTAHDPGQQGKPSEAPTVSAASLGLWFTLLAGPLLQNYFLLLTAASSVEKSQESWHNRLHQQDP